MKQHTPKSSDVERVALPRKFTDEMQSVWQGAFHAQLRKRHKHRFKPDCKCQSAEEAAWAAVVGQFATLTPAPHPESPNDR